MAEREHFTNGRCFAFGTGLAIMGASFGAQIGSWQHWITIGIGYGVGVVLMLIATVHITKSYFSGESDHPFGAASLPPGPWKTKWHWKEKCVKCEAELEALKARMPPSSYSTPQERAAFPSPQELRGQTLALAGDLCALLIGCGEPLDPPPVDGGYAGLGPPPPDDPKIENAVARSFSSRISDVRSHLGERGLLGESFNFSSFGDALNGFRVRNANGVRVIIKCLEQAAKKIDERFISAVPFAFASSPSRATDLRSLKEEIFQLVWELKEFYKSLSPCPGGDESLKDGTTEGLGRFAISHVDAISAWSSKIRHEYAAKFSVRVTDSLHKLGSKGLNVYELEQYSKSVDTDENVSNVIEALQKLASGIEGT